MLEYKKSIPSTNKALMNRENCQEGQGLYTFHQTQGKGTRGRVWQEQKGESLALSILCDLPLELSSPLPLIVGLAVQKALEVVGLTTGLKWSNDIVVYGKKLVGILCESRIVDNTCRIVIGVGVNLYQKKEDFDGRGLPHATSLLIEGCQVDGHKLAQILHAKIRSIVEQLKITGFTKELREEYESHCVTLGKSLEIHWGDGKVTRGYGMGIASSGALLCKLDTGEMKEVYSGDVSVRGIYGYS